MSGHRSTSRPSIRAAATLCAALLAAWAPAAAQPAAPQDASPRLEQGHQQKIWDLEHMSFVLETYLGKPFVGALKERDAERMRAWFTPDFRGELPVSDRPTTRRAGPVTEQRSVAGTTHEVDAATYVRRLLRSVAGISSFRSAVLKVLFIDNLAETPERWDVTLMLYASGFAADGSPVEHVSKHQAVLRFDSEERVREQSPIVAGLRVLDEVQRTSTQPLMEEVSQPAGLADLPLADNWKLPTRLVRMHRYQFAVEDYDRDGYPDIAVAATNGRPLLLRSQRGQRFEDVTAEVGLVDAADAPRERNQNALAGWIDYDNDGFPDLLLGTRLYHNVEGRRFEDVSAASGLRFDLSPFGAVVADYDGDGRLDLYVVNQKGFRRRPPGKRPWVGDPHAGTENHLWRNEGDGRFKSVTVSANAGGGWHQTFAAAALYHDDDPYPDLYLANDFGANVFLRNRGDGTFEDITEGSGTGDFATSMGVAAGDLDNDGTPELYVANMFSKMGRRIVAHIRESDYPEGLYEMIVGSLAGNRLYRRGAEDRAFEEFSESVGVNQVGWAFAPAMVDLDGDGWLDLYATAGYNSADRSKPDG